jgi:hypothetical protein
MVSKRTVSESRILVLMRSSPGVGVSIVEGFLIGINDPPRTAF